MYRKIVSLSLALLLAVNTPLGYCGGWVDDWLSQKTSDGPNYYEGQQRGYATAGSFNARWKTGVDYPVSVSPPSFKAGCGGIDYFGGSISFLNMDMLVAKLQRILQNSAGIAFNMALETVCPKCANIMNVMEQMSNQINGMAMNDCSIAKGLTVNVADYAKSAMKESESMTTMEAIAGDANESYEQVKRELTAADGTNVKKAMDWLNTKWSTPATKDPLMSGCPSEGTDLFPADMNDKKYVLDVIGTKLGMATEHIDLMRGMVGDIYITGATEGYTVVPVAACNENKDMKADSLTVGAVYAKAKDATACTAIADANKNMTLYVANLMRSVADKMKTKTVIVPGSAEEQFIINSPLPVAYALKVGIGSGQVDTIIGNMAGITASALTVKAMSELFGRMDTILEITSEQNAKVMNPKDKCALSIHTEKFDKQAEELRSRIRSRAALLQENMRANLQEYTSVIAIVENLNNLNAQMQKSLSARFGASVAQRAMR